MKCGKCSRSTNRNPSDSFRYLQRTQDPGGWRSTPGAPVSTTISDSKKITDQHSDVVPLTRGTLYETVGSPCTEESGVCSSLSWSRSHPSQGRLRRSDLRLFSSITGSRVIPSPEPRFWTNMLDSFFFYDLAHVGETLQAQTPVGDLFLDP